MAAPQPTYRPSARELTWHAQQLSATAVDRLSWASKMARDNDLTGLRAELTSARAWLSDTLQDVTQALAELDAILPSLPPSESELRLLDGNR